MKIVLLKACKLGKSGDYVEVPYQDGLNMIGREEAREPTAGEIRKAEGLPTLEELAEKHRAAVAQDAAFAAKVKARGNKFEPLKLEEIQQRNARASRGLCVV
jgi:ribosomal protein L9